MALLENPEVQVFSSPGASPLPAGLTASAAGLTASAAADSVRRAPRMLRMLRMLRMPRNLLPTVVLGLALLIFLVPLLASASFGFSLPGQPLSIEPIQEVLNQSSFWQPLGQSLMLAALTTALSLALLIPTLLWLHLKAPQLLPVAEWFSVIPYLIPAIALVGGASLFFRAVLPGFLVNPYSLVPFYVVLALPLTYRSIDAGIRALDIRTLCQASSSLGAGFVHTLWQAILPNLRSAVLSASLLCIALVLGEFALASLLMHATFPVFMVQIGVSQPRAAAALSFISIVGTWLMLLTISLVGFRTAPGRAASGRTRSGRTRSVSGRSASARAASGRNLTSRRTQRAFFSKGSDQ